MCSAFTLMKVRVELLINLKGQLRLLQRPNWPTKLSVNSVSARTGSNVAETAASDIPKVMRIQLKYFSYFHKIILIYSYVVFNGSILLFKHSY